MIEIICIAGAGTMGSGIAQVAAQSGYTTLLYDSNPAILEKAKISIGKSLQQLTDKQKITANEKAQALDRLLLVSNINDCKADVIIEAIIENINVKQSLFNQLAAINTPETIFASNTSSLSISEIQSGIQYPQRVAGLHFFNPAPIMKLVEVVKGKDTDDSTIRTLLALCGNMGKVPVACADAPGFIVNRVARHYYLEAMRLVESGVAGFEEVDAIMEATGFKMGPFKLMDLIGMDVNFAVSKSIYDAFQQAERFKPSAIQKDKVANDELGKKTGKGFYQY